MKIGIVGVHYGHISEMIRTTRTASNAEIVGLVEPDDALYRQYNEESTIKRYESLESMLAESRPEVVMEGLEHHEKLDAIKACANAGVHVLLDKPLCRTITTLDSSSFISDNIII